MKYDSQNNNNAQREKPPVAPSAESPVNAVEEVVFSGDSAVDKLQESVCRAGVRLVPVLKLAEDSLGDSKNDNTHSESNLMGTVTNALRDLGHFAYDISFAGEQSCGKSTVVNSLLQYPLMPTCKAPTTASVVQIVYSEHFRVRAIDDDSQKTVLDFDCEMPKDPTAQIKFREQFNKLLDYAISAMDILIVENFQYFTDITVADVRITAEDIKMTPEDPKHVMLLLFILLAVYVGQNDAEWDEQKRCLMEKRTALLAYLGIPKDTINFSIKSQGEFEILKSGLIITDLPGLGSNAIHQERSDGRKVKGHDEITKAAIRNTDSMVFITTPENREAGYKVLPEMLSSAKLKETVCKGDRIIPLLNKADTCGEQEIRTVIQAFCTALEASNVKKKPEDIRLYSGISGEYKFEGVPFERTLFFKNNYDDNMVRQLASNFGLDYEVVKSGQIKALQTKLQAQYNESGIEELLEFFRLFYIEIGKYHKSTSALQAMRAMVISVASRYISIIRILNKQLSFHSEIMAALVKNMEEAIAKPLAKATVHLTEELEKLGYEFNNTYNGYEGSINTVYTKAFTNAIKAYKEKLLNRLDKFQLGFLSSKARIDVAGSENRRNFIELLHEFDDFPVSLIEVNKLYENLLKDVQDRIEGYYSHSLRYLDTLRTDIQNALNDVILRAQQNISDVESEVLIQVRDQLLNLVEKQIEVVSISLGQQQQAEIEAREKVLSAIFDLNSEMTKAFAKAITKQVSERLSNGFLFKSKEYLQIGGSDGIKAAIEALSLTDEEAGNIALNLQANVNAIIVTAIPAWINSLNTILFTYAELDDHIKSALKKIIDLLSKSAGEIAAMLAAAKKQLNTLYVACNDFNAEVHPAMDTARTYMKDSEDSNRRLAENIFYECFDMEVVEEYEGVRNAQ